MRLPPIRYGSKLHRLEQIRFSGMDRRKSRSDGGIADMFNVSMDEYPSLQTRNDRGVLETEADNAIYYDATDHMLVIAGSKTDEPYPEWVSETNYKAGDRVRHKGRVWECVNDYGGKATPLGDSTHWKQIEVLKGKVDETTTYAELLVDGKNKGMFLEITDEPKEIGVLNDVAIITPDNKYYKIEDGESGWLWMQPKPTFDTKELHNEVIYSSGGTYRVIKSEITVDRNKPKLDIRFESDTSNKAPMGQYSNLKLSDYFKANDVVSLKIDRTGTSDRDGVIEGCVLVETEGKKYLIKEVTDSSIIFDGDPFADSTFSDEKDGDFGLRGENYFAGKEIEITKDTVDFKHMCIAKNRMWACKGDTIYASALGDCLSWTNYSGVGTDPWTTDTGSPGDFTACYEFGGIPIFFKRDCAYAVYGDYYSNFAAQKVMDRGVREDSHKSVCVVNSSLMWLSDNGVCAYTGGVPAVVSTALCEELTDGVASTDGFKYYLSAFNGKERRLYIYDTRFGTWTSEDMEEMPAGITRSEESLSYMEKDGTIRYIKEFGDVVYGSDGERFDSYIEFKDFYEQSMDKKDIGKILVRASAEPEYGGIDIKIMYDSDGVWHKVGRIYNQTNAKKVSEFGFFPRRCDHWRLRLESKGKFVLYAIGRKVRI